jgi:hypothetical protein
MKWLITGDLDNETHDSSHLTRGAVVCGNPSKALKARLKSQIASTNAEITKRLSEVGIFFICTTFFCTEAFIHFQIRKQPESVINAQIEPDENFTQVLGEVQEWKDSHQK